MNPPAQFSNCFVKLTPSLKLASWFSPYNNKQLSGGNDLDLGSAGVLLIPNTGLLVSGSKEGKFYLLDQSALGGFHPNVNSQIVQEIQISDKHHIHGCPTVWNGPRGTFIYVWPENECLRAYLFAEQRFRVDDQGNGVPEAVATTGRTEGMPGGFLSISANGSVPDSGIVWANHPWLESANQKVVEGVLRAFNATDLTEIWHSRKNQARDDFGNFAKFCPPTVANGKVYLPSMGGLHRKVTLSDESAPAGVALANLDYPPNNARLVIGWADEKKGELCVRWSRDGINWEGRYISDEKSGLAPALASSPHRLYMAWTPIGYDSI